MAKFMLAVALFWIGIGSAASQTFTTILPSAQAIPDGTAQPVNNYGAPLDVPIVVSGVAQGTIDTISVSFNASHTWVGDLEVTLISPYGQEHLLFARTGATAATDFGSSANLVAANTYSFSDTSPSNWWTAAGLANVDIPSSTARSVVAGGLGVMNPPATTSLLGVFQRRPPNGTWKLRFRDGVANDFGSVFSASITLSAAGAVRTVTKIEDTNDGSCTIADCSLREAITASSNGSASVDRIEFARPFFDTPRRIVLGSNLSFRDVFGLRAFAMVGPGAPLLNISGAGVYGIRLGSPGINSGTTSISGLRMTDFATFEAFTALLLHGMEFAYLTGTIAFDSAEINDSSIHSSRSNQGPNLLFDSVSVMRRVTVSGNAANGNGIAAIAARSSLTLIDCSIVGNQANGNNVTGGVIATSGVARLQNTLIAGNRATGTAVGQDIGVATGFLGSVQSLDHNLIGDIGSVTTINQAADQTGTNASPLNPVLSPLSRHGGLIPVHVPLPGSPLLDKGRRVGADVRGVPLVDLGDVTPATGGNNGDIGAVELSPAVVTNLNDAGTGSLRQVLADAPAAPAISDILFSLTLPPAAKITLTSGQLSIDKNVSIHGPGTQKLNISGNRQSRVVAVQPNRRVSISGLTLADGNGVGTPNSGSGGIVLNAPGSQLSLVDTVLRNGTSSSTNYNGWAIDRNAFGELISSTVSEGAANLVFADEGSAVLMKNATLSNAVLVSYFDLGSSESTIIDSTLGSGAAFTTGRLFIRNSLLSASSNLGPVISGGHNVIGATASTAFTGPGDQVGTNNAPINLLLSPLAYHGGLVPTQAPLAGSPALDKGLRFGTDARGQKVFDIGVIDAASGGDNSDVGAVEAQALFVGNTNDSGLNSLRQAVLDANSNGVQLDDVLFDVVGTIALQSRLPNPVSGGALNLLGTGADRITLSGSNAHQLFSFTAPGHLGMSGLRLIDFRGVIGGAIEIVETETHLTELELSGNQSSEDSGAVFIGRANAVIQSSTFANNTATTSIGALGFFGANSRLHIRNSTFSGNAAPMIGAIANVANGVGDSVLELESVTFAGNTGGVSLFAQTLGSERVTTRIENSLFSGTASPHIDKLGTNANVVSRGFNLSNANEPLLNQSTDRVNANAALGPLQRNGGAIRTHALLPGNAAFDAGIRTGIVDQRGSPRPSDLPLANAAGSDGSDIGALEMQSVLEGNLLFGNGFEN